MKRLTTETPKDNLEAALNLFYIKDHETWVRGGGPGPEYADVSLFSFIRDVAKTYVPDVELPEDNDDLSNMMPEWLMDGIDSAEGVVALLYTAAWAYAELRNKLMRYEDTGLEPCDYSAMRNALQKEERAQADLTEMIRIIGSVGLERLQELAQANQNEQLVVLPCKVGTPVHGKYENWSGEVMEFSINSDGVHLFVRSGGGGFYCKPEDIEMEAALAGKDSAAPDAPEEPAEPEWKSRVMRTFLGGR